MASTTGTKKELIDFLWDWADANGDWSKLLVSSIIATEQPLTTAERNDVFDYFLQMAKLKTGLPPLSVAKPIYTPVSTKVDLVSLSDVKGVNKLAKNQTITFGQNLTVIYGENGTGKTGYCRILKALGFSYEPQKAIFGNVGMSAEPQSAEIGYATNGTANSFTWDGGNVNPFLSTISVFNNNCVQISLIDGRNLIVSPLGFHLFNLISNELNALSQLMDDAIAKKTTVLPWIENLNAGTLQGDFVSKLNAQSTEQRLLELSVFEPNDQQDLDKKELDLKGLNKDLLIAKIKAFTTQINELTSNISQIENAEKTLTKEKLQSILRNQNRIHELEKSSQIGIKDIAISRGISFYETEEFLEFIGSAELYIKKLNKENYPNDDNEICVYCRQDLNKNAQKLLSDYRKLLNDTTQTELSAMRETNRLLKLDISNLKSNISFASGVFGISDTQEMVQPDEIKEYNLKLGSLTRVISEMTIDPKTNMDLNYKKYIEFLTKKRDALNGSLKTTVEASENLETQESALVKKIAELKDRKLLKEKTEEVKAQIISLKVIERLEKNRSKLSTGSISRKTTEAREELVKHNFIKIFHEELKLLRKSNIKIDLDFGTVKGTSRVQQKISSGHILAEILSEGEQKAIALAEYLTELQLDNSQSPVVFDDPVNSLDHHIIDDVARRLINLSRTRQVIICTHSILLFNSLLYFSKQPTFKALDFKLYNSKNQFDITGYITEAEEEINSVPAMLKPINQIINNTPTGVDEHELAAKGYGHLRSAIELFVEHEIFHGTVKRYQKNIALGSFVKVDGTLLNTHKDELNEIFERACGFIDGHSNPTVVHNEPTLIELKEDLAKFNVIRGEFLGKKSS